jgi:chromosomal replication initiation ATPase DnaA
MSTVELREFTSAREMLAYYNGTSARTGKYGATPTERRLQVEIKNLNARLELLEQQVSQLAAARAEPPLSSEPSDKTSLGELTRLIAATRYREGAPQMDVITKLVSDFYGFSKHALKSPRREASLTLARHIIMWLARERTNLSFPQIASKLGDRDHTTILHGCRRIDAIVASTDEQQAGLRLEINKLHMRAQELLPDKESK